MTDQTPSGPAALPGEPDERTPEEVLAEEDETDPEVGADGTGMGELP